MYLDLLDITSVIDSLHLHPASDDKREIKRKVDTHDNGYIVEQLGIYSYNYA